MYKECQVRISPQNASDTLVLNEVASQKLSISSSRICHIDILKRSIDARQRNVFFNLTLGVHIDKLESREKTFKPKYHDVLDKEKVIIIGAGPAGLFAALHLIELDYCPIIFERGKDVDKRRSDLALLYKTGIVNNNSNFGFGEGGAGTFSDGKLFTRSKKRGNVGRMMEILIYHGANESILVDSHPHLGTDKLPAIIANMRKTILKYGGEVHFNSKVEDLLIENNRIIGVIANDTEFLANNVILATGHSARDIYKILYKRKVLMLNKEIAIGLRLEHPQIEIDSIQYHSSKERSEYLPAAEYSFVQKVNGRGVYSFCMCPGGVIVPAATDSMQQVVNGMSSSGRNTKWANSAIVTSVGEDELKSMGYNGLFAALEFQEALETQAWKEGGEHLYAPAQKMIDFLDNKESTNLPVSSYKPGVNSSFISNWFPRILSSRIREGLNTYGRRSRGFISPNALFVGVETRTSSPLRIPRGKESFEHEEISGLYPCGEGAGYSGGIISSAMDGENCASSISKK